MKFNTIDLFAGCGGLCEGFEQSKHYKTLACVEWEKYPCDNLANYLANKWGIVDACQRVVRFDIQRTKELFEGWQNDTLYGSHVGLDKLIDKKQVDVIIGGPPCQAYSIAGCVRDENGMRDDYRNFLFESYIKAVKHFSPKVFLFENVPGLLSARPTGQPIVEIIKKAFNDAGYEVLPDLSKTLIDFTAYGLPQNRKRLIILGVSKAFYKDKAEEVLNKFYFEFLPQHKTQQKTSAWEVLQDLPQLYPTEEYKVGKKKYSHQLGETSIANHEPRWHSVRDQHFFAMLAKDIESGENKFKSTMALRALYTSITGKNSKVHKYHVIEKDSPSNLIPAHLFKDGLRHIHPDPKQARSITVREAARLQGFPDDYVFIGPQADAYKMIGNAVPPSIAKCIALALYDLLLAY